MSTPSAGPGSHVGPYRLVRMLGAGGMGTVYEAEHESIGRTVAVKLLAGRLDADPASAARFRREGRAQAALDHPHIVTVYEAGSSEFGPYLAMQLVRGPTLADLIADGELGVQRALDLLGQVGAALDAAHAAGLVHRDIKPRNVLVGAGDHAYLADFGLTTSGDGSGPTVAGQIVGTMAYLAPEVAGGAVATPASDRYAFAAMLFECLTGTVVFPRDSGAAMLYAHVNDPPPSIARRRPELPQALDEPIARALAKDPGDRPASATTLVESVARTLREHDAGALGPPAPALLETPSATTADAQAVATATRGRRWPLVGGGALAGALAATAVALAVGGGDDDKTPARTPAKAPIVKPAGAALPGTQVLGSTLDQDGDTRDCRGQAPTEDSPECSVFQDKQADAALVVPADGVVKRWGLRNADGEFALQVLRRRNGGYFQIARTAHGFASGGTAVFDANLAVERGDRLAVYVTAGSGYGIARAAGAVAGTWGPPANGADQVPPNGHPAGQLLLRVDYARGGTMQLPDQTTGAAAAKLPKGKLLRATKVVYRDKQHGEVRLVAVGKQLVLDYLREGKHTARMGMPLLHPGGQIVNFQVDPSQDSEAPEDVGVSIDYVNPGSERLINHYYTGDGRIFEFVN